MIPVLSSTDFGTRIEGWSLTGSLMKTVELRPPDSIGDNNGIIHGANWTTGKVNSALSFDSVDNYAEIRDKSDLDLPGRYTFMFWVKFNSVIAPESQCVFS